MTSNAPDPDAEAEVAAEVDGIEVKWTTAVHQMVLDMEAGFLRAEAEAKAQREAEQAALEAEWNALTPEQREAREVSWEEHYQQRRQVYLEEKAEAELFDCLEAEMGEPEISEPEISEPEIGD